MTDWIRMASAFLALLTGCARSGAGADGRADPADGLLRSEPAQEDVHPLPRFDATLEWQTFGEPVTLRSGRIVGFQQATPAQVDRVRSIVVREMKKYPASVLGYLDVVYVVDAITFDEVPVAGTCGPKCVYIAAGEYVGRDWERTIARIFHHEFSSVLLKARRSEFSLDRLTSQNIENFRYHGTLKQWRERVKVDRPDDQLRSVGFVRPYGTMSPTQDFNTIAGELFAGTPEFWQHKAAFPRLGRKIDVVIGFYAELDPAFFTEERFRSFATPDDPAAGEDSD